MFFATGPGVSGIDLTNSTATIPCVSITQADGAWMKELAEAVKNEDGEPWYYAGTLTVAEGASSVVYDTPITMSDFSSWGVPGTLEMKPEITAPGGNIYSVNGLIAGGTSYENMSGTSMATPQVAGMVALVAQYIRESGLTQKTGLTPRVLAQSLLMSTAVPQLEDWGEEGDGYYPVLRQGAGLANVSKAIAADSYILMGADANQSYADGKVKVELGDDPARTGDYTFSFSIHNLTDVEKTYALSADFFTQGVFTNVVNQNGDQGDYMDTWTAMLDADVTFDVGQSVVNQSAGVIIGETSIDINSVITDMEAQLEALGTGELFGLWFQSLFVGLTMNALSICIMLVIYGRMIEVYLTASVGPVPLATMTNREWGSAGQNYLKSLFALAFQAFLIMVCVGIYSVLVQSIATDGDLSGAIWACMGYTVLLCFALFKTGSLSKSLFGAH